MRRLILAGVALASAGALAKLSAAPAVSAIEQAFNLRPGMSVPVVAADGEHYRLIYRRLEALSHGEYAIVVTLEK